MRSVRTVVITGASGFLGKACCTAFTASGYTVRALVRDANKHPELDTIAQGGIFSANLPDFIDESVFRGADFVIHCAYTTSHADAGAAYRANILGTQRLRDLARQHGVLRFLFVSSLAAHSGARSTYGTTKMELEQELTAPTDTIVKPATIIGNGGTFERTRRMVRSLPIVPVLYGNRALQIIWIGDVCNALLAIVEQNIEGTFVLAHPDAVSMHEFYRGIADMDSRGKILLPLPGDVALFGVTLFEKLGLRLPITSENLLGIKYLHHFDPSPDLQRWEISPKSFKESLAMLKAQTAVPGG